MKTFTTPEIVSLNIEETANGIFKCLPEGADIDCCIGDFIYNEIIAGGELEGNKGDEETSTEKISGC